MASTATYTVLSMVVSRVVHNTPTITVTVTPATRVRATLKHAIAFWMKRTALAARAKVPCHTVNMMERHTAETYHLPTARV